MPRRGPPRPSTGPRSSSMASATTMPISTPGGRCRSRRTSPTTHPPVRRPTRRWRWPAGRSARSSVRGANATSPAKWTADAFLLLSLVRDVSDPGSRRGRGDGGAALDCAGFRDLRFEVPGSGRLPFLYGLCRAGDGAWRPTPGDGCTALDLDAVSPAASGLRRRSRSERLPVAELDEIAVGVAQPAVVTDRVGFIARRPHQHATLRRLRPPRRPPAVSRGQKPRCEKSASLFVAPGPARKDHQDEVALPARRGQPDDALVGRCGQWTMVMPA